VDGKEYNVPAIGITIGRDAACGVVVAQNEVSRKHAEVAPVEGGYEVRDFSANGVYVNGTRIEKPQLLSRADVIRVGTEEFRFYADVAANAPVKATPPLSTPVVAPPVEVATPVAPVAPPTPAPVADTRPVLAALEVANEGPNKGQAYEIKVPLAHIGRGAHNDVVINDDSVSDTHAKLQRRDDGWYVVDVGSTNGTYVGGQRITAERRLDGAPDVRFGGVKMVFRPRDAAADANKGTRAIASVDRSKLRPTATAPLAPLPAGPAPAPPQKTRSGPPVWIWGVVVLAIGAAAAFFLLNR
jgi:pSer/pThr/pTyr-binding forkhead associated (FHA) protein